MFEGYKDGGKPSQKRITGVVILAGVVCGDRAAKTDRRCRRARGRREGALQAVGTARAWRLKQDPLSCQGGSVGTDTRKRSVEPTATSGLNTVSGPSCC